MTRLEDNSASTSDVPPAPPAAPRPLTQAAQRAAWFEPHVRFWWMLAAVLLLLVVGLLVQAGVAQHAENRLLIHGSKVDAVVDGIPGMRVPPDTATDLSFTLNGQSYTVNGILEGRTADAVRGTTVPLLVDPEDPSHWTSRTAGPPFSSQLVAPAIAAIVFVIAGAATLLERARVLRTLSRGDAWLGRVMGMNTSALAPLAKHVRCAAVDHKTKLLVPTFVQGAAARTLREGDLLWLCSSGVRTGRTVPATLL